MGNEERHSQTYIATCTPNMGARHIDAITHSQLDRLSAMPVSALRIHRNPSISHTLFRGSSVFTPSPLILLAVVWPAAAEARAEEPATCRDSGQASTQRSCAGPCRSHQLPLAPLARHQCADEAVCGGTFFFFWLEGELDARA